MLRMEFNVHQVPLIFVAHSMGGLIVKEVRELARTEHPCGSS
jgi:hypothetical protein